MGGEGKASTGPRPAEEDDDKEADPVEESIEDTFPASDPPSWSTPAAPEDEPKPSDKKPRDSKE